MIFEPQCILLAEHDETQAALIRQVLETERASNTVRVLPDGKEIIACLSGAGKYADRAQYPIPCLALLDLGTPDSLGALAWIRGHPEFRRLPVVALTGSKDPAELNRAYELGANSCLVKPSAPEELAELVKAINAYWVMLVQRPSF